MYKLIINKVVGSVLIFVFVVMLCACGSDINNTGQDLVLEETDEELTYAEEDSDIEDSFMEDSSKEETSQEETETSVEDETFMILNYMKRKRNCIANIGSNLLIRVKLMKIQRIFAFGG